jgi:hypothetical protein
VSVLVFESEVVLFRSVYMRLCFDRPLEFVQNTVYLLIGNLTVTVEHPIPLFVEIKPTTDILGVHHLITVMIMTPSGTLILR